MDEEERDMEAPTVRVGHCGHGRDKDPDVDGLRPANDRGGKEKTMQHRRTNYDKTGSRLREAEACSGIVCKWDAQLQ